MASSAWSGSKRPRFPWARASLSRCQVLWPRTSRRIPLSRASDRSSPTLMTDLAPPRLTLLVVPRRWSRISSVWLVDRFHFPNYLPDQGGFPPVDALSVPASEYRKPYSIQVRINVDYIVPFGYFHVPRYTRSSPLSPAHTVA